jgi:hypothetical protein
MPNVGEGGGASSGVKNLIFCYSTSVITSSISESSLHAWSESPSAGNRSMHEKMVTPLNTRARR